jgi:hypothetical protein
MTDTPTLPPAQADTGLPAALPAADARADPGPSPTGSDAASASAQLDQARQEAIRHGEEAAGLRRTVAGLRSDLAAAERAHHNDVAAIGARLLEEAEDRGWCQDFDEMVDSLNAVLQVELPLRVRAWAASFDLRVSVRIESARNEDDARAQAATIAGAIERAVYEMTAVTASDLEDIDDFELDQAD